MFDWMLFLSAGFDTLTSIWGDSERSNIRVPVCVTFAVYDTMPSFCQPSPISVEETSAPGAPSVILNEKILLNVGTGYRVILYLADYVLNQVQNSANEEMNTSQR